LYPKFEYEYILSKFPTREQTHRLRPNPFQMCHAASLSLEV
jgi:hypothetical protein